MRLEEMKSVVSDLENYFNVFITAHHLQGSYITYTHLRYHMLKTKTFHRYLQPTHCCNILDIYLEEDVYVLKLFYISSAQLFI